ncbi:hypothetical protein [Emticicia sp. BO119]|uniref:hypothetical protein n=1 Tax=Emticicia sp. BO119 TaxID=2757768 RepID=UPI0015F0CF8C|nr:hypothetical protein [Emticicia sp. BO119]MBA4849310.1 hypothetical protein [Emticicia sp. BO119]
MESQFRKTAALCLLSGSLLATITMILHPSGGSLEHITHTKGVIVFSHSVAIFCLPFIGFGSWGLSMLLQTSNRVSMLSFFVFSLGLIAAMIAASVNGFILPFFVSRYYNTGIDEIILKTILGYGKYLNAAMDYIFIVACMFAIGIWSIIIVTKAQLPRWIGYYGFTIMAFGMVAIFTSFNFISVFGFRTFIFGLVSWLVLAGVLMFLKRKSDD